MGGRREDEHAGEGRPVEPEEARAHDNDPDAVRVHRRGDVGGEWGTEERTTTGRREDAGREGTGGRAGYGGDGRQEADGEESGGGMESTDKVLISTLAIVGVVVLAVILVLSLLKTPEWIQFVLTLVLFAALGLGAYRYVITPSGRSQESGSD